MTKQNKQEFGANATIAILAFIAFMLVCCFFNDDLMIEIGRIIYG